MEIALEALFDNSIASCEKASAKLESKRYQVSDETEF
jgi:hypothetical protein